MPYIENTKQREVESRPIENGQGFVKKQRKHRWPINIWKDD